MTGPGHGAVAIGLQQRQMQVALAGRVHVLAHVRKAVRCGDAPRAGRPGSGRGHTWRLSAAGAMLTATVRMGVQPEALALLSLRHFPVPFQGRSY
jgi:hypothetical protein